MHIEMEKDEEIIADRGPGYKRVLDFGFSILDFRLQTKIRNRKSKINWIRAISQPAQP
jgi:hypothetical protein